jgi:hypothetical protein
LNTLIVATEFKRTRAMFRCQAQTICDKDVMRVVYSDFLHGKYLTAEPVTYQFVRSCVQMLRPEVAESEAKEIDQGG